MKITRNNYEAFMLDYLEGSLPSDEIDRLMLFLENNPDLKEDLEGFETITLVPESPVFDNKLALKRNESVIHLNNYEQYFIAEVEGENSLEITELLALFLKENPSKKIEFEAYQKTRLIAPAIVFEDKETLKRERKVIPLFWWYSSAAAVILFMFLIRNIGGDDMRRYMPIANQIEKINNNLAYEALDTSIVFMVEEENIIPSVVVASSKKWKKNTNISKKKNKHVKMPKEQVLEDPKESTILAQNKIEEINKDSLNIQEPEQIISDEDVLYAGNVKITYEDEPEIETSRNNISNAAEPIKRKRVSIRRILTKSLVNKNILKQKKNDEDEVVAYAFNLGKLGFTRNKKKNKD